jgi:hypothetical protein
LGKYFGKVIVMKTKWLFILILLNGCIVEIDKPHQYNYEILVKGVLTQDGKGYIPKDNNGYYRLKLTSPNQQPHRITGTITENNKQPNISQLLEWESNLYWWIRDGDTIANITKTYVNLFNGQFTLVQLPPLISNKDELVPTINKSSYSGNGGEFNAIIAPIQKMKGDTMVVKVTHSESKKYKILKIVLE